MAIFLALMCATSHTLTIHTQPIKPTAQALAFLNQTSLQLQRSLQWLFTWPLCAQHLFPLDQ